MNKLLRSVIISLLALVTLFSLIGCGGGSTAYDGMTRNEISSLYKGVAKDLWMSLGKNDPTKSNNGISPMSVQIPNHTHEETGESILEGYKHNLAVNGLFVNFVGELYANNAFIITDKVVNFSASSSTESMEYDLAMSMCGRVDKQNNNVHLEFMMASPDGQTKTYLIFDIGYDFSLVTATSYEMIYYEPGSVFNHQIFDENEKMFIATNQELSQYQASLDAFVSDFEARKANGITLSTRFDAEFQRISELSERL